MDQNNHKHFMTKQAKELYELLKQRGVNASPEYWDEHKHIDIAIPDAHIYIEVDGLQHFTDPEQIVKDFKRTYFSEEDHFDTIHVPNLIIEYHLQEVADAIIKVVNIRINQVV